MNRKKKLLSLIMTMCLVLSSINIPAGGVIVGAASSTVGSYTVEVPDGYTLPDGAAGASVTPITEQTTELTAGWYVVNDSIILNGVAGLPVTGAVYIILADGKSLMIRSSGDYALNLNTGSSLTIFGQSGQSGMLGLAGKDGSNGEAGDQNSSNGADGTAAKPAITGSGDIIVTGGTLKVNGGAGGAGGSGGNGGAGGAGSVGISLTGNIKIYGGALEVKGGVGGAGGAGGTGFKGGREASGGNGGAGGIGGAGESGISITGSIEVFGGGLKAGGGAGGVGGAGGAGGKGGEGDDDDGGDGGTGGAGGAGGDGAKAIDLTGGLTIHDGTMELLGGAGGNGGAGGSGGEGGYCGDTSAGDGGTGGAGGAGGDGDAAISLTTTLTVSGGSHDAQGGIGGVGGNGGAGGGAGKGINEGKSGLNGTSAAGGNGGAGINSQTVGIQSGSITVIGGAGGAGGGNEEGTPGTIGLACSCTTFTAAAGLIVKAGASASDNSEISHDASTNLAGVTAFSGANYVNIEGPTTNFLTFTAEEAGAEMSFKWNESTTNNTVMYRANSTGVFVGSNAAKTEWTAYTAGDTITLTNVGDYVQFKGTGVTTSIGNNFKIAGKKIAASGSVTSLTDGVGNDPKVTLTNSCYQAMFMGCTSLTEAPLLPAKDLGVLCYYLMFALCSSLTEAPELPATELKANCYWMMFMGCTSLTEAPELNAETLEPLCYSNMFQGCTSLTTAPKLAAKTLAGSCGNMFAGCSSLTAPADMSQVVTIADDSNNFGCCQSMYSGCTGFGIYTDNPSGDRTAWKATSATAGENSVNWAKDMFAGCGNTVDITAGETYYIEPFYKLSAVSSGLPEELESNGGVTITVDGNEVTTAAEGTTVTAAATAVEGYLAILAAVDADGQTVTIADDGTFTMPAKAVTVTATYGKITTVSNEDDLNTALNYAQNGNVIQLAADIDLTKTLSIPAKTLTLDLAGHKLDGSGIPETETYRSVITILDSSANLTIVDSAATGNTRYWVPDDTGLWQLQSAKPESGTEGKDYFITTGGVITGGAGYKSGTSYYGGGVYSIGTLTIESGSIVGNTAGGIGGGVNNGGTLTMSGGSIAGNTASNGGGVRNSGRLTINGGSIAGNTAESQGGGVLNHSGTLTMTGGSIAGNAAKGNGGGGVYNYSGTLTIEGGSITGNTSSGGGGVRNNDTLTIEGGSITGNTSITGGGVYSTGTLTMSGGSISGNTTGKQGGGVYNNGTLTMSGGSIADNTAGSQGGGGIYLSSNKSSLIVGGTASVTENTAVGLTSNVDMSAGGTVSLLTGTPLEEGASIGLTSRSGDKTLTDVSAAATAFFSADVPNASIIHDGTTLTLKHADESSKTYVVENGDASGTGSLAEALYLAQAGAKITFAEGVTEISCPTGMYPPLYHSITLDGGTGVTIAASNGSSYLFSVNTGAELTMSHLILKGGYTQVSVEAEATLKATDCTFREAASNLLYGRGSLIIESCRFLKNTGPNTVQLVSGAAASFRNCLLADNSAQTLLNLLNGATLTMDQCTIASNYGSNATGYLIHAKGVSSINSAVTLNNCILANNRYSVETSETVYELYANSYSTITCNRVLGTASGWGYKSTNATLTVGTEDNETVPYENTKNLFVDVANGDYHLTSDSQAKDAGNNALVPSDLTTDLDGYRRIYGSKVDLGCYEWQEVAQFNSTNYPSLQAAIDAAAAVGTEQTPGEVKLIADVDLIETLNIASGKYVTLDLAGHVLSGKDITAPLYGEKGSVIHNEGILTITDTGSTVRYWISNDNGLWQLQASLPEGEEGVDYFTTTGGCITGGKGYYPSVANSSTMGGGVYNSGTLNITGGNIVGNTANKGGGVSNSGTLNLTGGSIVGNSAPGRAGGVYNSGTMILAGGNIIENTTTSGGGVYNSGTMKFSSGSISGNHTFYYGGGIWNNSGTLIMIGGSITDNSITSYSIGGAGIDQYGTMYIGGTAVIKNNKTNGVLDNLFCEKKDLTVAVDPDGNPIPLTQGAEIWVNAGSSTGQITLNGAAADAQYFHPENLVYRVKLVKGDTGKETTDPLYNDHFEIAKFDIATLTATAKDIDLADTAMTDTQAIAIMTDDAGHKDGIVVYAVSDGNYSYLVYDSTWSKADGTKTLAELKQESKVYIIGEITEKTELTLSATVADVNWTGEKITDPTVTAKLDQTTKDDVSGYDFAYYDMENETSKLSENPSKAGYYKLVISIKDDDSNYYGTSEAYYFLIKPVINNVDGESGITTETDYVKNEQVDLELHSSADPKDFIKVMVTKPGAEEAEEVPNNEDANYTVDDGSIKVTLKKAYLDTLESGTYVFHIISGIYTGTEWMKDVEQKTIEFSADITVEISDGCKYEACFAAGTNVTLLLGGKAAGKYTIAKVSNGYTIQDGTEYIALSADGKSIVRQTGSYTWKYDGGLYGEMKTTTTTKVLFWSRKSTKTTKVYLAMGTEDLTVSSKSAAAKLQVTGSHEWAYTDNNDGSTHKVYCSHCGKVKAEAEQHDYSYDETNHKCICGHVDPDFSGVKTVTVKETSKTSKTSGGNYFCGIGMYGWNSRSKKKNEKTTYTYTISTTQVNVKVKTIAYSLTEDGTMTQVKNNQFTSATKLSGFYIDVTDSNGVVTHWYYDGTKTTQLEEQRPQ